MNSRIVNLFNATFAFTTLAPQEEAKSVGVYRPPGYRAPGRRFPVGKSKTPEIDSEIAFPSLAASMATNKRCGL